MDKINTIVLVLLIAAGTLTAAVSLVSITYLILKMRIGDVPPDSLHVGATIFATGMVIVSILAVHIGVVGMRKRPKH